MEYCISIIASFKILFDFFFDSMVVQECVVSFSHRNFPFFLLLISSFIALCSEKIFAKVEIFLYLLKLVLLKQITSPGWMHETSAWGWCTGKTQRDQVKREVGGGDRDGEYM